ncbi:EamA-like transporter family protein [Nitzschia inconspicua]|uniref:EamA-like transporter family protein n=1 Tax=Nitzschia inconspicua TaxID=303405 RepID=A0A9K3KMU1_9STRA|nr:EamA-like transporter family protein [Nitzschia inconspicua]
MPAMYCQKPLLQALIVFFYLSTWVANGEMLQKVTTQLYKRPASTTWFSYNFMTLSFLWVAALRRQNTPKDFQNKENKRESFTNYWRHRIQEWAGTMGIAKAVGVCVCISQLLMALNVFMVSGLQCISVSLSNAIYQLQTPLTILLSMIWLKERFCATQAKGIILAIVGVAFIVVPPLDSKDLCIKGILQTIVSSMIGAVYLISWRWLDRKNAAESSTREGFVDAHFTLGMIGVCNLLTGWPILIILHILDIEQFEWPNDRTVWLWLIVNGIVEYLFDVACAVAIYVTSPVVVSVTAPLTIPLSILVDRKLHTNKIGMPLDWFLFAGGVLVLVGTVLMETKPSLSKIMRSDCEKRKQEDFGSQMVV